MLRPWPPVGGYYVRGVACDEDAGTSIMIGKARVHVVSRSPGHRADDDFSAAVTIAIIAVRP